MGDTEHLGVFAVREGCSMQPGSQHPSSIALAGMVGEVILKDCRDFHSADLPNGVLRKERERVVMLHTLLQGYI